MHTLKQLKIGRSLLLKTISTLSPSQCLEIPNGFRNNILWHLGHIFVVGENLANKLSNQPTLTPNEWDAAFGRGTSPATWSVTPELNSLKELLEDSIHNIEKNKNNYTQFQEYTTSAGIQFKTIEDALQFLIFHDGIHTGNIMTFKNLIKK